MVGNQSGDLRSSETPTGRCYVCGSVTEIQKTPRRGNMDQEKAFDFAERVVEAYQHYRRLSLDRELAKMDTLGPYNPENDTRIMSREAQEELIDVCSYMRFLSKKHPTMKTLASRVTLAAFNIWWDLEAMAMEEGYLTDGASKEGADDEGTAKRD